MGLKPMLCPDCCMNTSALHAYGTNMPSSSQPGVKLYFILRGGRTLTAFEFSSFREFMAQPT